MIARLLISKSLDSRLSEIEKTLSQFKITKNHPDLLYFSEDSKLGIEQARIIKKHFSLKPYQATGRVAVLEDASTLTPEAQNAILKTLEELPNNAALLLGAKSEAGFLPTILSRCQILLIDSTDSSPALPDQNEIDQLLNYNITERFAFIEKNKNREELLQSLVKYFHKNSRSNIFLKELVQAEEWAAHNVNIRAILEYLMLKMPSK